VLSSSKLEGTTVSEFIKNLEDENSPGKEAVFPQSQDGLNTLSDKELASKIADLSLPIIGGPKGFSVSTACIRNDPDVPDNFSNSKHNLEDLLITAQGTHSSYSLNQAIQASLSQSQLIQSGSKPLVFPKNGIKEVDLSTQELHP
jgi:hypothetical protein